MNEKPSLFWEDLAPCMICMIRWGVGETSVVAKGMVNDIH